MIVPEGSVRQGGKCPDSFLKGMIRGRDNGGIMLNKIFACALVVTSVAVASAGADVKEDVLAATKKLAGSENYSWTTSSENAQGVMPGGGEGKTQRDGLTMLKLGARTGTMTTIFFKDGKGAYQSADGTWHATGADAGAGVESGDGRMITSMVASYQPPATQAQNLAQQAQDLHKSEDDGSFAGTLSTDDAKALVQRRVVRGAGGPVEVQDAKAAVKFWAKDGVLSKFQIHMEGKLNANGQERPIDRTTTVEIKDVGTTSIDLPEEAKAKITGS